MPDPVVAPSSIVTARTEPRSPRLRPVRAADAEAVWALLEPAAAEVIGMTALPGSAGAAERACADSAATQADLAAGSFRLDPGCARRLLLVVEGADDPDGANGAARGDGLLGITGITFKRDVPNLAVQVATSATGQGLDMASSSAPWTRTELDSTYLGPGARGRRLGTLLSRGRFPFLHLVASQIPPTVASHLRGRFDLDGSAPFWGCFGARFAPWATSTEAERALGEDPSRLAGLAGHRLPVTAEVLHSLGPVNTASLPAFHLLMAEGLRPNGMYDPIDGGPTLVAEIGETRSGRLRVHGRTRIAGHRDDDGLPGAVDALVSVAGVDRFRVVRTGAIIGGEPGTITVDGAAADALGVGHDALVVAVALDRVPDGVTGGVTDDGPGGVLGGVAGEIPPVAPPGAPAPARPSGPQDGSR